MGDDKGLVCGTATSNAEVPPTPYIYSRLEREWKVTKTNFAQDFNWDVTLHNCAVPGMVVLSDLRLLVDDDGDFTDATVYAAGGGLSFAYSGNTIQVTGISATHIPNNSTRYITIASVSSNTPLPVELVNYIVNMNLNLLLL